MSRFAYYNNKSVVNYEDVSSMFVIGEQVVQIVFKSGAVVTIDGYQGLATGFYEYCKTKQKKSTRLFGDDR